MFEKKKTITVKGVTFDMILVEGDKFRIGNKEHELCDFYMAEIPVTQELYMAVLGSAHTGSYNMMPENFDYLHPKILSYLHINESFDEYQKRRDIERAEKLERERIETERIRKLSASLPVNNIAWFEAIEFINKLNQLTGLNFALPSFEQWYFAASGGTESHGYNFAGSDDANEVGHFHTLSTKTYSTGLYVMSEGNKSNAPRKAASVWYNPPRRYKPNELGLYDMSGLVNEWLDEAGMMIGGEYNSNPDYVSKEHNYGYTKFGVEKKQSFSLKKSLTQRNIITAVVSDNTSYHVSVGSLYGFRLILCNHSKEYNIPKTPFVKIDVSSDEKRLIKQMVIQSEFGILRSIICKKYIKYTKFEEVSAYSNFQGNIYNVFACPQGISDFSGNCFNVYNSRRKFLSHCKDVFLKLIKSLVEEGYNLLIHDDLDLKLTDTGIFTELSISLNGWHFPPKNQNWINTLSTYSFVTNNPSILTIKSLPSLRENSKMSDFRYITLASNTIFIDVRDTFTAKRNQPISDSWIYLLEHDNTNKVVLRLTLNAFCDFNGSENDFNGCKYSDTFQSKGIVMFMRECVAKYNKRINDELFDNSERVNRLFCKRNKGGLFEYNYPTPSGEHVILDERFFVLPHLVYDEWHQTLVNNNL